MMTASGKLTNEQRLDLEFINRLRCETQHEHAQDQNIQCSFKLHMSRDFLQIKVTTLTKFDS